jgi:hypothetical protein
VIGREPVATTGALGVLITALVAYLLPAAPVPVQLALAAVLTGVVVAVARRFSFPIDTLLNAGLDPQQVARDAADDAVKRFERPPSTERSRPRRAAPSRGRRTSSPEAP